MSESCRQFRGFVKKYLHVFTGADVMYSRSKRSKRRRPVSGPGDLVFIGEDTSFPTRIDCFQYDNVRIEIHESIDVQLLDKYCDDSRITWLDVKGLADAGAIEAVGRKFNIHGLAVEDILNSTQRPKLEDFGDYVLIVLRSLRYIDGEDRSEAEQVSIIMGKNFVITFRDSDRPMFDSVVQRLKVNKSRLREGGSDYLTYSCLDVIVDNYFIVLEKIGDQIEDIEDALVYRPTTTTLGSIHQLKTDLIFIRKSLWPLREMVSRMLVGDTPFINESLRPYLRDLFDHAIHAIDTVEAFRDITSGMIDIYLSSVNNRLSETMRFLTIISTIFIPLTFLCGWYGMNFENMPELKWGYGYPMVIIIAITVAATMIMFFRKKKWI